MPFPNEHAARLLDPNTAHIRVRRTKGSGKGNIQGVKIPESISVIWYIVKSGGQEVPRAQSLRFPISSWTEQEAKQWLKKNEIKFKTFEPASEKKDEEEKFEKMEYDDMIKELSSKSDESEKPKLRRETRIDYMYEDIMTQKFERTPEGFLKGRAVITNVGIFNYLKPDGSMIRELRLPEDVFDKESIDSLMMSPLTNGHPNAPVDSENVKEFQKGFIGDKILEDGYHLSAPIVITDAQAVQDTQNGKRALSAGYTVDLEDKQGVWMGQPYDAIQRNIRYNHVAIVDRGRAGDDVVMKFDSVDAYSVDMDENKNSKKEVNMLKKIKIDGVEYEAEAKVIENLHNAQEKADQLSKEIETLKDDNQTITAEKDSLKDENDSLKKDIEDLKKEQPSKIDEAVKARILLLETAKKAGVEIDQEKVDEISDIDIKKSVILKAFPKAVEKLDNAEEIYVNARFDAAVEYLEERGSIEDKNKEEASDIPSANNDGTDIVDVDKSREKMIKDMKEAYKRPEKQ